MDFKWENVRLGYSKAFKTGLKEHKNKTFRGLYLRCDDTFCYHCEYCYIPKRALKEIRLLIKGKKAREKI